MITMHTKSAGAPGNGQRVSILKSVPFANATGLLSRLVRWIMTRQKQRSASRSLKLEETVSLGQKRFVALLTVNDQRYLVGGGADDVVLLASLGAVPAVLDESPAAQVERAPAAAVAEIPFRELLERSAAVDQPKKTKLEKRARAKGLAVSKPESVPVVPPVVEFLVAPKAEERPSVAIEEILPIAPAVAAIEPVPVVAKEPKKAKVPAKVVVRVAKSVPSPAKAVSPAPAKAPQAKTAPVAAKEPSASHAVLHRPAAAKTVKKAKPSARGGGKSKR